MLQRIAALILLLVTVALTHAQHQVTPSGDDEATKKLIIGLETKTWELAQKRDVKDLAALVADDYQDVGEFGVWDKQKSVQSNAEPGFELSKFSLDHFRFTRLAPTVVLLTYEAKQTGSSDGKPLPSPLFISSVWVNRKGKWLSVLYQDTPAAAPAKADDK